MKKLLLFLLIFFGVSTTDTLAALKLTNPNGGEMFVIGSDTLITWQGISESDTVSLEYSLDNGKTWIFITDKAMGLKYIWKNIPPPASNECLVKVKSIINEHNSYRSPYLEWENTFDGWREARSVQQTSDGGYIVTGVKINNNYKPDGWIAKLDTLGNVEWEKLYGDDGNSIQHTKDSGYVVCGKFNMNLTDSAKKSFSILKLDELGNVEWGQSSYTGFIAKSLQQTKDSGYIVAGCGAWSNSSAIFKLNKNGDVEWEKNSTDLDTCELNSVQQTKDSGYIAVGSVNTSKNGYDYFVVKLDNFGKILWKNTFGGDSTDQADYVKETKDGGFIISGITASKDGDITVNKGISDYWLLKLDKTGIMEWQKTYGGSYFEGYYVRLIKVDFTPDTTCNYFGYSSIFQNSGGGFIFAGSTGSHDGDVHKNFGSNDVWVVKLDEFGNILWERTYGENQNDIPHQVNPTIDGGFVIAGETYTNVCPSTSKAWVMKFGDESVIPQEDVSDVPFSIVAPQPAARDVDMGKVFVGEWRDSTVADFVSNIGSYKFRVDSIYIRGADKTAFSLIGGFPKYNVEPNSGREAKFKFIPNRVGMHYSEIVIITQTNTMVEKIRGEGLKKPILISTELKPFSYLICEKSTSSTIEIKSTGGDTLRIKELNLTGTDYQDFSINEPLPINLAPDSTKTITIGFKTNVPGIKTAALEIKSNADPDSVLSIPLTGRKDSITLVPNPKTIDLGTLFPNQSKDSSFIISNLGTIKADGKVTFTNNISCANPTFAIDSGGVYILDFTFTGIPAEGIINEKITVWDEVCKYFRDVLITGKVVSPHLLGFSAVQCKSYSNEYKLTLNNNTSNLLKITKIEIENNSQLFIIDPNATFPITIDPFATNYEVKVKYEDNSVQKFSTAVNCLTDDEFIPILTDSIYLETVEYKRSTDGLINDTIHNENNPFAVSYDSASQYGKNKFTYSIKVNESANDMDYLTELSDLEVIINYNRNVLGADFDTQTKIVKVRLSDDIKDNYSMKSAKETKIDEFNSQIIVNLENVGKPITTKDAFKLLNIDFTAYLGKEGLSDEQNSDKSRSAVISHIINSTDKCISYESTNNAEVTIEKICVDEIRSIKITDNPEDHFYLGEVIPQPVGSMDATIEYGLGFECKVTLTIYDISGAIVITPVNEIQKAGTHKQAISRKSLSAGAYFIEMKAGQFKETKKIIVE